MRGIAARRNDALQFAAADDVKTAAEIGEHAQHGEVGVGLHREAHEVIERRERAVQLLKMVGQRALRIDVERRAKFFGQRFDGNTFAIQLFSAVMKSVHKQSV